MSQTKRISINGNDLTLGAERVMTCCRVTGGDLYATWVREMSLPSFRSGKGAAQYHRVEHFDSELIWTDHLSNTTYAFAPRLDQGAYVLWSVEFETPSGACTPIFEWHRVVSRTKLPCGYLMSQFSNVPKHRFELENGGSVDDIDIDGSSGQYPMLTVLNGTWYVAEMLIQYEDDSDDDSAASSVTLGHEE